MTLTVLNPTVVEQSGEPRLPTRPRQVFLAQMLWFTGIGMVMMLAYLVMYAVLAGPLGMQVANVVAWVATAVADTSANRRVTFGVRGQSGAARAQVESLLVFGTGMLITSGALLALATVVATPGHVTQLGVLIGANIVAGLLRFMLLRTWVFAPGRLDRRVQTASRPVHPDPTD